MSHFMIVGDSSNSLSKSKRLLGIIEKYEENKNLDQIILQVRPPIFRKDKDIVKKQAQTWSTDEVKEMIYKVNDLEASIKKDSANSMLFVSDFVSNY